MYSHTTHKVIPKFIVQLLKSDFYFCTSLLLFYNYRKTTVKTLWVQNEGWAQDCSNSNIFLKPLFRGNFDPFVNNANLGAIAHIEGWAQDYGNSNIFLKPLFRGNLDPFVNNANLGAIAHTSNGT